MTQAAFDDRYGDGAFTKVMRMLDQPCVTFAQIAAEFGVTRERVRQWHRRFMPDAPTGHARQRRCAVQRRRRRVFEDPLFRAFFQHARAHFGPGRIEPIRSRSGYRLRAVMIDSHLVALRDATTASMGALASTFRYRGAADYVFVRLDNRDFVFAPARVIAGATWRQHLQLQPYRNSFESFGKSLDTGRRATAQKNLPIHSIDSID